MGESSRSRVLPLLTLLPCSLLGQEALSTERSALKSERGDSAGPTPCLAGAPPLSSSFSGQRGREWACEPAKRR